MREQAADLPHAGWSALLQPAVRLSNAGLRAVVAEGAGVRSVHEHLLVPMLFRLDFYTGQAAHPGHARATG